MPLTALQSRTLAIAGGGIAGMATAVALARVGFRSIVFERAPAFAEIGAGLQLSPNATRALAHLGLLEEVQAIAVAPLGLVVRAGPSGEEIVRVPFGHAVERRFGRPWLVVHRADLLDVLVGAATETHDIDIRLGTTIEDHAVHARGVTVSGMRGQAAFEETAAGLVGTDGLWSAVRTRTLDPRPPVWRNRTAWRALIPRDDAPDFVGRNWSGLWLGPDAHLVHYPLRGGREINIVAIVKDTLRSESWSNAGAPAEIIARFAGWSEMARSLVAAPKRWMRWALADRDPLARWGAGAQTLAGDAAHPMLPFLAQGAALSLEDAVVLAAEIAARPADLPAAMRAYERARMARTARAQREARRNGSMYHLSGLTALARDAVLRARGGESLLARYGWLYGWRPAGG